MQKLFSSALLQAARKGVRFIPKQFGNPAARKLSQIVSPGNKHVLKLHPYDLPQDSLEVLAFALNFVLAMCDAGFVDKLFEGGKEHADRMGPSYRMTTQELLRSLESIESGAEIRYRKQP
jgi:hypothetical protein